MIEPVIFMKKPEKVDIRLTDPFMVEIFKNAKRNGIPYSDLIYCHYELANGKGLEDIIRDLSQWAIKTSSNAELPGMIHILSQFLTIRGLTYSEKRTKAMSKDLENLLLKYLKMYKADKVQFASKVLKKGRKDGQ